MAKRKSANTPAKEVDEKKPEDVVETGEMAELAVDGDGVAVPPGVAPDTGPGSGSVVEEIVTDAKVTSEAATCEASENLTCGIESAINSLDVQVNCAAAKTPALKALTAEEVNAKERQEAAAKKAAEAKEIAEASPWHTVEAQSDKDTTIEACNIATGYQMPKAVFMRCRIDGKIHGDIKLMQGLEVKLIEGQWKLQ